MMLKETLENWGELALKGYEKAMKTEAPLNNFNKIIITGMGGSGIIGDALRDLSIAYSFEDDYIIVKEPWLPGRIDDETLVLSLSYSGNTLETLMSTVEAVNKGAVVFVLSSDGRLLSLAEERGLPYISITQDLLPRASFPEMFFASLTLLSRIGLTGYISTGLIKKSMDLFNRITEAEKKAEDISREIMVQTPVFITCRPYVSVGLRFKYDLAENAKKYSILEVLPEAGHNSIESLKNLGEKKESKLIYIIGSQVMCRTFASSVSEVLGEKLGSVAIDFSGLNEVLQEVLWGFWVSGYTSLFIASKNNVIPEETPLLKKYREMLTKKILGQRKMN